ncbi:hypothetical protein J6524_11370 [Bradyrhizobium sp. WSM 1738]|uniref:hypothetical protein n=1 Tax=Bradyrhizobium hereditatis TaxID=2821405 RepID=UPI001CE39F0A|nr:hypothetical protein [Bradyrhizobium hereditatis]MCA6115489.1 hypothetical protein [Bradyrhizobium hereditatis]
MSDDKSTSDFHLLKAAGYVRQLIAHVANEGTVQLDGDAITPLLVAVSKIDNLTPEEETQFWKDYQALVKQALPARPDALSYADYLDAETFGNTADPEVKKIVRQQESLKRIRRISIAAFSVTLVLFAYLSITESAISRNNLISEEYSNLGAGITKGSAIEKTYQAIKDEPTRSPNQASNPSSGDRSAATGSSPPLPKPDGGGGSAEGATPNFTSATKEQRQDLLIEKRRNELETLAGYNDSILRFLQFRWLTGTKLPTQFSPVDGSVLVAQQSVNALISKYLLPVFAALLGVTVYILRSTSAEIKSLSFRTYESGVYSNRLALGVVGGIAISWFSVTDTTGIVGSITPSALAFLVGYSVEVLYNILDSLVKALGANEKG